MSLKLKMLLCLLLFAEASFLSSAQTRIVSGVVTDESGLPMVGAGVLAANSGRGVFSDVDGHYSISLQEEDETVLTFSYLGYTTQQIVVNGRSQIDVTMLPDASNSLNDAVVIGYGTTRKSDLTGSVASVKMNDIVDSPTVSVDHALQGKVAGVDIMSTSGEPGATTSIRVRGTRSIMASNEPLIVVDGVIDAVSDMSEINPDDIESISILKDASSTAIYGSRGANGVVIVTTKKGTAVKPSITAKAGFGVSWLARKLDLMDASELISYRNDIAYIEAYVLNPGGTPSVPVYDPKDFSHDTDWVDEVTRAAFITTANVSVSGKARQTRYFVSGAFNRTQGIVEGSGFTRGTARLNLSHDFTDWFTAGVRMAYTYADENPNKANIGGTNIFTGVVYLAPYIGPYDSVNPLYENGAPINTPRVAIDRIEYNKIRQNASYSGILTFKPVKGLTLESQNTYTPQQTHVYRYSPSTLPARYDGQGGLANRTEYDSVQLMTENTITWNTKFGRGHSFSAMAGFSATKKTINSLSIAADGIVDDNLKWNNLNAVGSKEGYTNTSYRHQIVRQSVLTRLNYNFGERYYLTFTARADGSSNFADNKKWGFFPSGAFKWNLKNESWMRPVRWIDNLSLRLSAGRTGNDAISPYQSLGIYSSSTSGSIFNGTQSADFYPSRVANPDLTWETTDMYNAGLDFSVLKGRVSIVLDAYHSRTSDLLLQLKTIQSTGFSSRWTNLGEVSNSGVELAISTRNIEKRNFGWTTDLTVSHNAQKVLSVGNEDLVGVMDSKGFTMYGYKEGYPLNALWGFDYRGVFHNVDEVMSNIESKEYVSQTTLSATNPNYYALLGRPKYADVNNDGLLTRDDLKFLGSADPIVQGGLQNTFNIHNLRLGIYFTYSIGGYIYNYSELAMSGGSFNNQYRYMNDSWHPVRNPDSDLPRAGIGDRHVPSSLQVHDASYLRLKTLSLSYTFSFDRKQKSVVKSLSVGLSGENLWLWTKYNGFDPDVSTSSDGSTVRRADIGAYPSSAALVLNLQIKL